MSKDLPTPLELAARIDGQETEVENLYAEIREQNDTITELQEEMDAFYDEMRVHMTEWLERNVGDYIREQYLRVVQDFQRDEVQQPAEGRPEVWEARGEGDGPTGPTEWQAPLVNTFDTWLATYTAENTPQPAPYITINNGGQ